MTARLIVPAAMCPTWLTILFSVYFVFYALFIPLIYQLLLLGMIKQFAELEIMKETFIES